MMIEEAIEPIGDDTDELSMKAPMLVSKPAFDIFTQVRALSMEVKPYSCLINIDDMGSTRVDLPRDRRG